MAVGELFLAAFLQVLFDRLASRELLNFARRYEGLGRKLDKWKHTLKEIQAVLQDAGEKQLDNDGRVEGWLDDLRDLAYDVEDILDEFATEVLLRKLKGGEDQGSTSKVRNLIPGCCTALTPSALRIRVRLGSKIKEITVRFNDIVTRKDQLKLKETVDGRSSKGRGTLPSTSLVNEARVYGREKDKEAIVQMLLSEKRSDADDAEVSVIPILGMGGLGKTTLAQLVYNDEKVQRFFNLKAWACVSEDFDAFRVTKTILKSVVSESSDESDLNDNDLNMLQVKLKEKLSGKKFLVILDDVWNENYHNWTILRAPFEAGAPGSAIVITTRNQVVSSTTGSVPEYRLQVLSNDSCLSVFTQHALGASNFGRHPDLRDIGEKIVERCKGLPLAAKTLGGLLRTTLDHDKWEDVLESNIWDIPEERSGILPALMLSYHHLPSHLKRCFMYCSILPKDYEFEEQQLVRLWMAEGLIQPRDGDKQMEDLGSKHFHDLLSRSFFQHSNMKESQFEMPWWLSFDQLSTEKPRFVMHDLINDLAQRVAGDICFRMEDRIGGSNGRRLPKQARHSSYLGGEYDRTKDFEAFFEASFELKCLRTFLPLMLSRPGACYLTYKVHLQLLPKLLCLRVLSLSGYCIVELPDSIGDLKHLRYLDLSYTRIRGLPESTTTLYNLQTLILENCFYLKELPSKLGNLVNLRHLNILNANKLEGMPPQIGKLTFLQTLSNLIVGKGNCFVLKELGSLLHLRGTLVISQLENATKPRDASDDKLIEMLDLTAVRLEWSVNVNDSQDRTSELDTLNMLHPKKSLKELTIRGYGGIKFSTWLRGHSFPHVVLLRIENCKKCTSLPPIGQLPSLKHLFIGGMASVKNVGVEFYGKCSSLPFRLLETLWFKDMEEWEKWSPNGGFPHLLELSILRCPKLRKLGIRPLPSLKVLSIAGLASVKNVGHEFYGEDCSQPFRSLETLRFESMKEWENWRPNGEFPHLRELSIKYCPKLLGQLPNHLPFLKKVLVEGCKRLVVSISSFPELCELDIEGSKGVVCRSKVDFSSLNMSSLPTISEFTSPIKGLLLEGLTHVKDLAIKNCEELTPLWSNDVGLLQPFPYLHVLKFENCPKLVSLIAEEVKEQPQSDLPSTLREICIYRCNALECFPKAVMYNYGCLEDIKINGCDSLKQFAIGQLPSTLKRLEIWSCRNVLILLDEDDSSCCSSSTSLLEYLSVKNCPSLKSLTSGGELPATLKLLSIDSCEKLESIAKSFHHNSSLEKFIIHSCESLISLPMGIHTLGHLEEIEIIFCPTLVSFPDGGLLPGNLRELRISDMALPNCIHSITSLQNLQFWSRPSMVSSFPKEGFPVNLTSLDIWDCNFTEALLEWGLHKLTSLKRLRIRDECLNLESFPKKMMPASLTSLTIERFHNLKYLSSEGFRNLDSLEELLIDECENLTSFPEDGLPPSLQKLYFRRCPRLKERCKKDKGREWSKIAHIPLVAIDHRFIHDPEEEESK
jgi:hypothetical protein